MASKLTIPAPTSTPNTLLRDTPVPVSSPTVQEPPVCLVRGVRLTVIVPVGIVDERVVPAGAVAAIAIAASRHGLSPSDV